MKYCLAASARLFLLAGSFLAASSVAADIASPAPPTTPLDALDVELAKVGFQPRSSHWQDAQKQRYVELLNGHRADVLVVPCQVQGDSFDRVERFLIAARLAVQIQRSGLSVVDPFLASRALGETRRVFEDKDIELVAGAAGATQVLTCRTGHDGHNHMSLVVQRYSTTRGHGLSGDGQKAWSGWQFSDEDLPSDVFALKVDEVAKALGYQPKSAPLGKPVLGAAGPADPKELDAIGEPLVAAANLEWVGSLQSRDSEVARDRPFEKALLLLDAVEPKSVDRNVLRATALLNLRRRPAALALLRGDKSAGGEAVAAALDGNLVSLQRAVREVPGSILRAILELMLDDLRAAYGALDDTVADESLHELVQLAPSWEAAIRHRASDWNLWRQPDPLELKRLLDRIAPLKGFSADDLVRAGQVLGSSDQEETKIYTSIRSHVMKLLHSEGWRRPSRPWPSLDELDLLELLEGRSDAGIRNKIEFEARAQGRPNDARRTLSDFAAFYDGQPEYSMLASTVDVQLAARNGPQESSALCKSANALAFDATYWLQGWAANGVFAMSPCGVGGKELAAELVFINVFGRDFPVSAHAVPVSDDYTARMLDYKTDDFRILAYLLSKSGAGGQSAEDLFKRNEPRFVGSPDRLAYLSDRFKKANDADRLEALYKDDIEMRPRGWDSYFSLGLLEAEKGDYAAAAALFDRFPGFSPKTKENPVALSNYASDAGSIFFWRGKLDVAKRFYHRAAELQTGSEASITSAARLALLDGDYRSSALAERERASRYDVDYAYRDYLSMLHALGLSTEAWAGFDALKEEHRTQILWASAFIGQRIEGWDASRLNAWLLDPAIHLLQGKGYHLALSHAIAAYVVDRMPPQDFGALLDKVDLFAMYTGENAPELCDGPYLDGNFRIKPSVHPGLARELKVCIHRPAAYFGRAYRALREGQFGLAQKAFQELAQYYDLSKSFALPYAAWASARSGDATDLEKLMNAMPVETRRFDYYLARAFIAGAGGKHKDAIGFLRNAFDVRPHTESRPVPTEYQYAQACQWLFDTSHDEGYRELLLDWSRVHQKLQPYYGWAYAMEAKYTNDRDARRRALAMTLYLDKNSEIAAEFSEAEKKAALEWLAGNNPFRANPNSANGT